MITFVEQVEYAEPQPRWKTYQEHGDAEIENGGIGLPEGLVRELHGERLDPDSFFLEPKSGIHAQL